LNVLAKGDGLQILTKQHISLIERLKAGEKLGANSRAVVSAPPPGVKGTTSRTWRGGAHCARAGAAAKTNGSASALKSPMREREAIFSSCRRARGSLSFGPS
jgi:hypothetical protein